MTDKAVLEHGEELSDQHIQMAQSIIKKQFPLPGGLRNRLGTHLFDCFTNTRFTPFPKELE